MNQLFEQMILSQLRRNPNYAAVEEMIQQAGGNPETAFLQEAQKRGVDPQQILERVKSMINLS